jgi:dihydrofolate reductase
MIILGNPAFTKLFVDYDLIDEYHLTISLIILGSKRKLFDGSLEKMNLKLKKTKVLDSGVVCLGYQRKR